MAADEGSSLDRPFGLGPPNSFVTPSSDMTSSAPTISLLQIPVVQPTTFIDFAGNCSFDPAPKVRSLQDEPISEEEAKRRRELLARRPSYRKILNDLSGYDLDIKPKVDPGPTGSSTGDHSCVTCSVAGSAHSTVIPSSSIPDDINDPTRTLMSHGATPSILHYAHTADGNGQLLLPMGGELLGLKPVAGSPLSMAAARVTGAASLVSQGLLPAFPSTDVNCSSSPSKSSASSTPSASGPEEAARKRELRLLKNREAAKECRRKKKEYVRCLENRVAVLETQNKQLIEELKNLKELYCQKAD
uniref:BZIP domain-containing protein n=1 Tax=Trichuris muris TaxID=70415 RepID=A0A5S6Q0P0_TRIMR